MAALGSFRRVMFSAVRNQTTFLSHESTSHFQRYKQTVSAKKIPVPTSENQNLLNWELTAAVCLTRLPLVSPHLSQLEKSYMKLLENQEFERSVYCDWEVEKLRQNRLMKAVESGDAENDAVDFKVTHEDMEDEYDAKFKEFTINEGKSTSEWDDTDRKNPNRKLRNSITYVVKKKLGNDEVWVLPSAPIGHDETMRECADRALSLHSLDQYEGTILSNAPSGYFKYKFPKEVRLKNCGIGAKVFIFSGLLKNAYGTNFPMGQVEQSQNKDSDILDHAWVTKDELSKLLKPKYFEAVSKIIT